MNDEDTYKLKADKNSWVHPSYAFTCLHTSASDWNDDALDRAVKVWQLSLMLPQLPGSVLHDIVRGRREMTVEEEEEYDYLLISEVFTEEEE